MVNTSIKKALLKQFFNIICTFNKFGWTYPFLKLTSKLISWKLSIGRLKIGRYNIWKRIEFSMTSLYTFYSRIGIAEYVR